MWRFPGRNASWQISLWRERSSGRTQQRLLSKDASLILQKALDITRPLESAIRQAAAIQNESQKENRHVNVFKLNKQKQILCFHCTGTHSAKVYSFINKQCFCCKNKRHIEKVCPKKTAEENI